MATLLRASKPYTLLPDNAETSPAAEGCGSVLGAMISGFAVFGAGGPDGAQNTGAANGTAQQKTAAKALKHLRGIIL
jgi:hypothetical protein